MFDRDDLNTDIEKQSHEGNKKGSGLPFGSSEGPSLFIHMLSRIQLHCVYNVIPEVPLES